MNRVAPVYVNIEVSFILQSLTQYFVLTVRFLADLLQDYTSGIIAPCIDRITSRVYRLPVVIHDTVAALIYCKLQPTRRCISKISKYDQIK
jgi:hypothetical protein